MKLVNLGSGSKGNSTLVLINDTLILIDAGICFRRIKKGLELLNKKIDDIDCILITHSHIDHIKYINIYDFKKIYTTKDVLDNSINPNILEFYKSINIKGINIEAIKTSHDVNSCGFIIYNNEESLVYITDTGYLPLETLNEIKNKKYYIIESNHDISMLLVSKRTNDLKKRILSSYGHLSNDLSANYMKEVVGDNTKLICLAHLSEECNEPSVALNTYFDIFNDSKYKLNKDIEIVLFNQKEQVFYDKD